MHSPEDRVTIFAATADRPIDYPEDLPFLPGMAAVIPGVVDPDTRMCTWFIPGAEERATVRFAEHSHALEEVSRTLEPPPEAIASKDGAALAEWARALPAARGEQFREAGAALFAPDPIDQPLLEQALVSATEQSVQGGWTLSEAENGVASMIPQVRMLRANGQRLFTATPFAGSLIMIETLPSRA